MRQSRPFTCPFVSRANVKVTDPRLQTPICCFLQLSAKIFGFLRKSAVFCGFLRSPDACISKRKDESAKICGFVRKSVFWARSITLDLSPSVCLEFPPEAAKNTPFSPTKRCMANKGEGRGAPSFETAIPTAGATTQKTKLCEKFVLPRKWPPFTLLRSRAVSAAF